MKKSIKWGIASGVLVLLAGAGITAQYIPKTDTTSHPTVSQADKDSYKKALAAIKTAEESLSDKDIATAKKLVKKATRQQSMLKTKLRSLEAATHWRTLKSLIAAAKTNPTEATIQAAQDELTALLKNNKAKKYHKKSDYIDQVHELQLKHAETYVAKAEETTTQEDYTAANDRYNSLVDLYNNALNTWQRWSYLHGNALDALLARLKAIQVGAKVAPSSQVPQAEETTQVADGATDGEAQAYTQDGGGYTQSVGEQTYTQQGGGQTYTPSTSGNTYAAAQNNPHSIEDNITVTDEDFYNEANWMTRSDGQRVYIGPMGR